MEIVVLVKVVPGLDELRYDPERRTVDRASTPLFLNPFDQRALRVALDLRRPGDRVSVVSMGPRAAAGPLRESLAAGADRAILVSDPHLAGSDTLATARVLAAAVRPLAPGLVLAGAWTTDSETGQVGPEVAELLGLPAALGARALERTPDDRGLRVTVDTHDGWARFRLPIPALVAVGEKIAKPIKVEPEARDRVPLDRVELRDLVAIGLSPATVGDAGSPTVVRWVREEIPRRAPTLVAEGTPEERVRRAIELLEPLLVRAPVRRAGIPAVEGPSALPWRELLVLVSDGRGAYEPWSEALLHEPAERLPGFAVSVVWIGPTPGAAETARLGHLGVSTGYAVEVAGPPDPRAAALAFGEVLDHRPWVAGALFVADGYGREVAARVAASRSLGLTGDAVDVGLEDGAVVWAKPSFGGRTLAGVSSRTSPSLATVRPGAWSSSAPHGLHEDLRWQHLAPVTAFGPREVEGSGEELAPRTPPLDTHDVIVTVGMGIGGPERVPSVRAVAERWHAGLGATRRVVDAGWVPRQHQVGLTGRHLAPRLAVLLGVSGSTNHLVGLRRAGVLLAVNPDPAAPVFGGVDVGIVGTLEEILPRLEAPLADLLERTT
ncbi:MAG TPA: FAD-binding protein [Thermoplasmata archaeon]|nr:FAD-binding protein [Thermoplasmata archaeon]